MTANPTTLESLRAELLRLWQAEEPGEVKGLLRAAYIAINTICRLAKARTK